MKKITFSLQVGLVGLNDSGKEIFLNYLKKKSIKTNLSSIDGEKRIYLEFFVLYKQIPIKIKVFLAQDVNKILYSHENIKKLDCLILTLNLYNLNSKNIYRVDILEEFKEDFIFNGTTMLVGFDTELINKVKKSTGFRISRFNLIEKAKELDVLYCFEIQNNKNDLKQLYHKMLKDYIFKYQISRPELIEQAKEYGKALIEGI